ncbi:MAG: alkaline phosphatase D family protein [Alphaproteobacteria bacterium]|nr:alkaline phosphatase D family protein [Alphaproteobacteria bacterium]
MIARRRWLGAALAFPALSCATGQPAVFGLGVASGDPAQDSVVIWTRLDTAPDAPVPLRWEVAEDEAFARIIARGDAVARPESAHAVHVVAGGLRPGRQYWYRFAALGVASPVGRTKTLPERADTLRFANTSCQHYEHGFFTAWSHIARDAALDFVFFNGDYIYEYAGRAIGSRGWGGVVRSHEGAECVTLAQYRARYAQYRRDADLQAAHAAHPFIMAFDDHEVENNWAGPHSEKPGTDPAAFAARKAAAFQAWYEHMPVRPVPRGASITAYRRFRLGDLGHLHVLDTRSFRDDQPCGDRAQLPCDAVARTDAQMLGAAQEEWLFAGARAPGFHILAQQVFMAPRRFADGRMSMDAWDGYPAARERLLGGLRARGVTNPIVLTGDVHRAWAADMPGGGAEFICSSITSEGDGREAEPNAAGIMEANRHIQFHHARRGWTRHEITRDHFTADYMALPFVTRAGSPAEHVARFVTARAASGISRA